MQEIKEAQVQSLGWEDPLQQEMVIHWVFLTEKSHGQKTLAGHSPWGCRVQRDRVTKHARMEGTQQGLPLRFPSASICVQRYGCFFPLELGKAPLT